MITLRPAMRADTAVLETLAENEPGYFARCFDENRLIIMAAWEGEPCGYAQLNFAPRYKLYQKLNYPEIQDVNVLPDYRRRGAARAMIEHLEDAARAQGFEGVGISVGITREFGPAQILYAKMGYIPDGFGATIDREGIDAARSYPAGELVMMLIKNFMPVRQASTPGKWREILLSYLRQ